MSKRSSGRGRLPTWVVKMRSTLSFIVHSRDCASSMTPPVGVQQPAALLAIPAHELGSNRPSQNRVNARVLECQVSPADTGCKTRRSDDLRGSSTRSPHQGRKIMTKILKALVLLAGLWVCVDCA